MKGCLKLILLIALLGALGSAFGIKKLASAPPKEMSAIEKEIGEAPIVVGHRPPGAVTRAIKETLKDPASLQFIEVTQPVVSNFEGRKCWMIVVRYRAKNGFGGYSVENGAAYVWRGNVLALQRVQQ